MKISDVNTVGKVSSVKKKGSVDSGTDFGALLSISEEDTAVQASAIVQPLGSLDGLLSMQEISPREVAKKQVKRGREMLDELDQIRIGLLSGQIPAHTVQRLVTDIRQKREAIDDKELTTILDEIEVRVEVELAKLEMAKNSLRQ